MPPPPSFDYYAELQVERSASLVDINAAYRRLARIHHPDKNPDSQEEATQLFQRLHLAYETLSDPAKRARYDNAPRGTWSQVFGQEDDDGLWEDEDDSFGFPPFLPFLFTPFFPPPVFRRPPRGSSQSQGFYAFIKAELERRSRENKRQQERARELREEEQRQRREAKEAREREAERSKSEVRRRLQDEELKRQEKRWKEMGAVSKNERLRVCLHSELCDKVQHTKKFKCTVCLAKRGMTAFECPHCSAFLCQLCVTKFSERRKKLEMQEQMEKPATPKDSAGISSQPTINKPIVSKPTTAEPATKKPKNKKAKTDKTAKQNSTSSVSGNTHKDNLERDPCLSEVDERMAAPTSGGQFASDNPYDILAGDDKSISLTSEHPEPDAGTSAQAVAPLSPAQPNVADGGKPVQSKKKRKNKKPAHVNLNGKNQHACSDLAVDPKKANASIKPQEPASHTAPSREQNPTCPKAGSTGGYIRALGKAHSLTVAGLRQKLEIFGAVRSLRITNKRRGTAHVDFATHDSLCRAIAASPVVIGEQATVRLSELHHCDICEKDGHSAKYCGYAKIKGPN